MLIQHFLYWLSGAQQLQIHSLIDASSQGSDLNASWTTGNVKTAKPAARQQIDVDNGHVSIYWTQGICGFYFVHFDLN